MARTRKAAKPSGREDGQAVKLTLSVPAELARRFGVHAEMVGLGKGELMAEMIRAHCRRFVVSDRGSGEGQGAETDAA